jgi:hypothetical protein
MKWSSPDQLSSNSHRKQTQIQAVLVQTAAWSPVTEDAGWRCWTLRSILTTALNVWDRWAFLIFCVNRCEIKTSDHGINAIILEGGPVTNAITTTWVELSLKTTIVGMVVLVVFYMAHSKNDHLRPHESNSHWNRLLSSISSVILMVE